MFTANNINLKAIPDYLLELSYSTTFEVWAEIDNPTKNSRFAPFSLRDNSRTTLGLRITKASLESLKPAKTHTF
jgi:hypothetical protein